MRLVLLGLKIVGTEMMFNHVVVDISKSVLFIYILLDLLKLDVLTVVLIIMEFERNQSRVVNEQ